MINFLRLSNNIKIGDYLHSNGAINNIASSDIIGVCVIPELMLPDGKARFISMAAMDPRNKEKGNCKKEPKMEWYYNGDNYECDFLVQRRSIPLDTNSEGIINGYSTWGRMPLLNSSDPKLTIDNPQDPGTKYYDGTTNRIPSPYTLDGSFNLNFHYRGSEKDEWALTDYRGDLNTRKVIYREDPPGEEDCLAFYCCNKFSPGYRDLGWYLPAIGELAFIIPRFEIIKNKMREAINAGSPGVILSNEYPLGYWSSSECSSYCAWFVSLKFGSVNYADKDTSYYVRAFLAI